MVRLDDLDSAIPHYAEAVRVWPDDAKLLRDYGTTLLFAGEPERAIELLERAAAVQPGDPATQRLLKQAREAFESRQSP